MSNREVPRTRGVYRGESGFRAYFNRLAFPQNGWASLGERLRYPPYRMILLGPPGVGKGTIAAILKDSWRVPHFSTGEKLRHEVASDSELGRRVKSLLTTGLVPDEEVVQIVENWLLSPAARRGVIFDGFPRTVAQARALDAILLKLGLKLDRVVALTAPEGVLVQRMIKRGRDGETEETMRLRLEKDREETVPVVEYYRRRMGVMEIDGTGTETKVASLVEKATWPRSWFHVLPFFARRS